MWYWVDHNSISVIKVLPARTMQQGRSAAASAPTSEDWIEQLPNDTNQFVVEICVAVGRCTLYSKE
jgi:hypothetical protein